MFPLQEGTNDAREEKPIAQIRKRTNSRTPSKTKPDNKKQIIELKVGGRIYSCTICEEEFTNLKKFMNHSIKAHMHKITNDDEENVNKLSESKQLGTLSRSEIRSVASFTPWYPLNADDF